MHVTNTEVLSTHEYCISIFTEREYVIVSFHSNSIIKKKQFICIIKFTIKLTLGRYRKVKKHLRSFFFRISSYRSPFFYHLTIRYMYMFYIARLELDMSFVIIHRNVAVSGRMRSENPFYEGVLFVFWCEISNVTC